MAIQRRSTGFVPFRATVVTVVAICIISLGLPALAGTYLSSSHGNATTGVNRSSIDSFYNTYATGNCGHCHEQHASIEGAEPAPAGGTIAAALAFATEQDFCYECHDGSPAPLAADVKTEFTTLTYKHGKHGSAGTDYMETYDDRHRVGEKSSSSFSGIKRHSECVDCHNPHEATDANPLQGATGLDVTTNGSAWTEPTFPTDTVAITNRLEQYKVCFKCHSGWAGTGTGTSQALEFNTNNPSYHNVEGVANPPSSDTYGNFNSTYVYKMMPRYSGYTDAQLRNVTMICSDCHGNTDAAPQGVHGSSRANILKVPAGSPYTNWDNTISIANRGNTWCFNCHDPNFTNSAFSMGGNDWHTRKHNKSQCRCQTCHSAVPHGWKRDGMLIYTHGSIVDPAPYNGQTPLTGLSSGMTWAASGNWRENYCHNSVGSCG